MLYHFLGLFQLSLSLSFLYPFPFTFLLAYHSVRAGGERDREEEGDTTHEDGNKNVNIAVRRRGGGLAAAAG